MEDKNDLIKIFKKVSKTYEFSERLIEKDYYLTRILHKLSKRQVKDLVFKGGTCLNKCYLDFYRLSENLDFVYNQDVKNLSKNQVRKILGSIRKEFFEVLDSLDFKTNKELGKGWKMLTSKKPLGIVGLEITTYYISLIDDSEKEIKIEVSFRKKLIKTTKIKTIKHKFYNALNEPILNDDIKIEVIDLVENFAEKFRALYTRDAIRDIYDINHIIINEVKALDKEIFDLIILKINEDKKLNKKEFIEFIKSLKNKVDYYDIKELETVLRSDEKIDIDKIVRRIEKFFGVSKKEV